MTWAIALGAGSGGAFMVAAMVAPNQGDRATFALMAAIAVALTSYFAGKADA